MLGITETLEKARALAARIKKAKNDLAWMSHHTDSLELILQQKTKLFNELQKDLPVLSAKIAERREHLAKLDKFVDKHSSSIENTEEIERVAIKMAKLMAEVSALRTKLETTAAANSTGIPDEPSRIATPTA